MSNISSIKRKLGFSGDPRTSYAQAGWQDALNGRPINYRLLDSGDRFQAMAYETARYRVLALRAAGLTVPNWNSARTVPPAVRAAIALANSYNAMGRRDGEGYWPVGPNGWQAAQAA